MQSLIGRITRLRQTRGKGFGFIKEIHTGTDYFFHRSRCLSDFDGLDEGDRVTFNPITSEKGPRAGDVKLTADQ